MPSSPEPAADAASPRVRGANPALWIPACLIALAAIAAPLAVGASSPYGRLTLETTLIAALAVRGALKPARPAVLLGIGVLAAGLGAQLIPLPHAWLERGAPLAATVWSGGGDALSAVWPSVSVNPAATAAGTRRSILGAAVIVLVADLARRAGVRRFLCAALAVAGLAIVTTGLVFPRRSPDRLVLGLVDLKGPIKWWLTPLESPIRTCGIGELTRVNVGGVAYLADEGNVGDVCGPYIYSNHFAGGLCLTLPFAWAIWLMATRQRVPDVIRYLVVLGCGAATTWLLWKIIGSRGGTAAFAMATLVFLALAVHERWSRWLWGIVTAAYAVAFSVFVVAVLGQVHGLVALVPAGWQRGFATALADPRVRQTAVAMDMFRGSPWLGTGVNTYDDMNGYLTKGRFVSYFAHNEYAELLGETGLLGAAVALGMALLLARRLLRFYRTATGPSRLLGAGAWAAVAGIAAHSWFEWNLHLPANGFLAAVVTGLAWSAASSEPDELGGSAGAWRPWSCSVVPLTCALVWAFLCRDALAETAERALRAALTGDRLVMQDSSRPSAVPLLAAAIAHGERMADWDPGNARLAVLLGQAHLHLAAREQGGLARGVPGAAERWFSRAQSRAPAARGIPQP